MLLYSVGVCVEEEEEAVTGSAERRYGVATISRLLKIIRLFGEYRSLFVGLFCKRDL